MGGRVLLWGRFVRRLGELPCCALFDIGIKELSIVKPKDELFCWSGVHYDVYTLSRVSFIGWLSCNQGQVVFCFFPLLFPLCELLCLL